MNRAYAAAHPEAERLGSLERVTAERHGAIRVGNAAELAAGGRSVLRLRHVSRRLLRSARAASPVPVVSTAFRPIDPQELARNPFRVFTSMLATADRRFFSDDLRPRVSSVPRPAAAVRPGTDRLAPASIAADGGCSAAQADDFVEAAVAAFALSREPIDRAWYDELSAVSAVAADIAGVTTTHINHLTPRVLDIDELQRRDDRARHHDDRRTSRARQPRTVPDVLLRQTSFRALAEPRRFRDADGTVADGTLRVRFGEVEQRGVALTPQGRQRYDAAMASADPAAVWDRLLPRHRRPRWPPRAWPTTAAAIPPKPVVYEDFLPASAAGIFRSNLDGDSPAADGADDTGLRPVDWMAGQIGPSTSTTPTTSTRKSRAHDHRCDITPCPRPTPCAPGSATHWPPSAPTSRSASRTPAE